MISHAQALPDSKSPRSEARDLIADRAFCETLLPEVSRTFAPSIEALPDSLRDAVRVAYLLCRVVDSIEDQPALGRATRTALFDAFDRCLIDDTADVDGFARACAIADVGGEGADGRLCRGAPAVFHVYRSLRPSQREAIRPHVLEMSAGMRAYCARAGDGGLRLADLADLERYCYYVAGTVGNLLTALFEQTVPALDPMTRRALRGRAVSFGLGLQIVNIVKDVAEDFTERGACFLPLELMQDHGVDPERLLDAEQRPRALAVVRAVCARARDYLHQAREYTSLWPSTGVDAEAGADVRMFCLVPLALALATLRAVEESPDTLRAGATPKVSRQTVGQVFTLASAAARSDAALASLFDTIE